MTKYPTQELLWFLRFHQPLPHLPAFTCRKRTMSSIFTRKEKERKLRSQRSIIMANPSSPSSMLYVCAEYEDYNSNRFFITCSRDVSCLAQVYTSKELVLRLPFFYSHSPFFLILSFLPAPTVKKHAGPTGRSAHLLLSGLAEDVGY